MDVLSWEPRAVEGKKREFCERHAPEMNGWNLKMHGQRNKAPIFGFHVNFRGCVRPIGGGRFFLHIFFFEGCFQGWRIFTQQKWRDWKMDLSFYSMFVLGVLFWNQRNFLEKEWLQQIFFQFGMASFKGLPWFWKVLNRFHPAQKNHIWKEFQLICQATWQHRRNAQINGKPREMPRVSTYSWWFKYPTPHSTWSHILYLSVFNMASQIQRNAWSCRWKQDD